VLEITEQVHTLWEVAAHLEAQAVPILAVATVTLVHIVLTQVKVLIVLEQLLVSLMILIVLVMMRVIPTSSPLVQGKEKNLLIA
jgi:hypothetical protein